MNNYDILNQFASVEPYRTIIPSILVFGLLDRVLKGKLNLLIQELPSFLKRFFKFTSTRLKHESINHFSAIPKSTHRQQKIFGWLTISVEVLLSAFMTIQGFVFMLLSVAIINRDEPSMLKFFLGMGFGVLFCAIAYFYRAGAHKTAKDNNIDIRPWK